MKGDRKKGTRESFFIPFPFDFFPSSNFPSFYQSKIQNPKFLDAATYWGDRS
jgi:hypothetical protein